MKSAPATSNVPKIDLSKVLITGAGGMIASYIDFGTKVGRADMDITDLEQVTKVMRERRPQAVIHLAALTNVELCDKERDRAYLVNGVGTFNVATAAAEIGAKMVYVSTSGIFDGSKRSPYDETDVPHPQNYYGRTKYLGELAVQGLSQDYMIVRVCWVFGGGLAGDKRFVGKLMAQLGQPGEPEIRAVDDMYGSPTYAKDMVAGIKKLLVDDSVGIFHLSNVGSCSRYEMAELIMSQLGSKAKLIPVGRDYFPGTYKVKNEAMSSKMALMRPWQEALKNYLKTEWKSTDEK